MWLWFDILHWQLRFYSKKNVLGKNSKRQGYCMIWLIEFQFYVHLWVIACQKMSWILDQSALIHFNWFAQSASHHNDRPAVRIQWQWRPSVPHSWCFLKLHWFLWNPSTQRKRDRMDVKTPAPSFKETKDKASLPLLCSLLLTAAI